MNFELTQAIELILLFSSRRNNRFKGRYFHFCH